MIRELGVHSTKYTPANMTAAVAMVTGMGAQIKVADGTVILPAAEAASDIYFVEKERTVEGIYASITNLDDYFDPFVNVKAGDFVKIIKPVAGELYGVDQFSDALADGDKGKRLSVGVDGKWAVAKVASPFVFEGFVMDGTHKLAQIRVSDTAVANG
nr:MAG TPA: hypothetical protein [Caudoviricetes sp.]